jgi:[acyl-carrier-protein] S-malonyltransferase
MFAAVYPGQGSQHSGMGKFLHDEFATARRTFEEASDALHFDMRKLCLEGAESDLALTENTQPALLTVSTATYRVLGELAPLRPVAAAGHSVGEYAAVVNAGAVPFGAALKAVRRRGELMQSAVPMGVGAMAAVIALSDEQVRNLCAWAAQSLPGKTLEPANFNAPGQVVISGHKAALDWLQKNYTPDAFAGAPARLKLIPLKVSAPFHCSLMKPAEEAMDDFLAGVEFADAGYPVVQNVTAKAEKRGADLKKNLVRQISSPVRWVECTQGVKTLGATRLIEIGCGKVLAGLTKKIDPDQLTVFNLNSLEELKAAETELLA